MEYRVKAIREAGVTCKWSRTRKGSPIIVGESRGKWYCIDSKMWDRAKTVGIREAFEEFTLLGDIFSIAG